MRQEGEKGKEIRKRHAGDTLKEVREIKKNL
jgi:hypothetical protein